MTGGGDGFYGLIVTDKHKKAISDGRKEYFDTPEGQEWKEKLSAMYMGNEFGKGTIAWNKGLKDWMSDEIKEKKSFSTKEYWKDNIEAKEKVSQRSKKGWAEGKFDNRPKPSEETKKKISLAGLGRKQTDYQKQKASEANKGKIVSQETRDKLSAKNKGFKNELHTCVYCGLIGGGGAFKRSHNDNCKYKNLSSEEQDKIKSDRIK